MVADAVFAVAIADAVAVAVVSAVLRCTSRQPVAVAVGETVAVGELVVIAIGEVVAVAMVGPCNSNSDRLYR